jgi:hypothetical protein
MFTSGFVDQLFSRIAEYLKKHNASDRNDILAAIEYGFQSIEDAYGAKVQNLDRAANISEWIQPYLAPITNVTQFRQFKIEKIEGKVVVSARSRCADDDEFNAWQNLNMGRGTSQVFFCFILFLFSFFDFSWLVGI